MPPRTHCRFAHHLMPTLHMLDVALRRRNEPPPGAYRFDSVETAWLSLDNATFEIECALTDMAGCLVSHRFDPDMEYVGTGRRIGLAASDLIQLRREFQSWNSCSEEPAAARNLAAACDDFLASLANWLCELACVLSDPQEWQRSPAELAGRRIVLDCPTPSNADEVRDWVPLGVAYSHGTFERAQAMLREGPSPMERMIEQLRESRDVVSRPATARQRHTIFSLQTVEHWFVGCSVVGGLPPPPTAA